MTLFPELDNLDLAGLIESFTGDPLDGPEYGRTYYDEVAYQIGQQGDEGLNYLWDRQGQVDADRQGAILLALSTLELRLDRPVEDLLRSNLDSDHPLVIAEAIDGLRYRGIDTSEVRAQVVAHDDHPSPWVRAAVLRYLSRLFPDEARPILVEALHDPEPLIRENAVDELIEMGAVELVDIDRLLDDPNPRVRESAQSAQFDLCWFEAGIRVGWNNALLVLAIRHYQEFLADAGVPPGIVAQPSEVHDAAAAALQALQDDAIPLQDIIDRFLASVRQVYEQPAVDELMSWVTRHFTDSSSDASWWIWTQVLPMLGGVFSPQHLPRVPSPLDPAATDRFNTIVRSHFSHTLIEQTDLWLDSAEADHQLSEVEQRWLEYPDPDAPDTSVSTIDIRLIVDQLIHHERAYRTWREIKTQFTDQQVQQIYRWAKAEALQDRMGDVIYRMKLP